MRGRTVFDPHYKVSALTKSNILNQIACIFSRTPWFCSEIHNHLWSTHQIQHLQAVQQLAVTILKAVSLINNHTTPGDLPQLWAVR